MGMLYLFYGNFYWGKITSAKTHLIFVVLALIFNILGWAMNHCWLAFTGGILYSLAAVIFLPHTLSISVEIILSFVGFAKLKENDPHFRSSPISSPTSSPNSLNLTSKDLIKSGAMVAYCKHYHFDNGISHEMCKDLFLIAENVVPPDTEVVMAFIAIQDYKSSSENAGLCGCAFAVHKLIIASSSGVLQIPTEQITTVVVLPGTTMSTIQIGHQNGVLLLGVDSGQANEILDFFKRSLDTCMADIALEKINSVNKGVQSNIIPSSHPEDQPIVPTVPNILKGGVLKYNYDDVHVVGTKYLNDFTFFNRSLIGDVVVLEWEIGNQFDDTAIIVRDADGHPLGHLPKGRLKDMVYDWLERNDPIFSVISDINYEEYKLNLRLGFYSTRLNDIRKSSVCRFKEFKVVGSKNREMQENLSLCAEHDSVDIEYDSEVFKYAVFAVGSPIGFLNKAGEEFFSENIDGSDFEAFILELTEDESGDKISAKVIVFY